ncbi:MAG: undecaprenyldiphospho-muramoylpentapeptide beta-N-acetylglucosaminyltransferase [Pseudomonadota bacterium]|nr:undecaprenyldiphospho-muramoylpentapeptide beta-N-acetylglucosaminyltransferase [Pseudomonadota bacterium]
MPKQANAQSTVLIMAGGTGGHIFPGLAVAKALQEKGYAIEWLGSEQKMEADLVPKHGIPFNGISVSGLRGKGKAALLKAPWMMKKAIAQATQVIKRVKPVAVVGFGGFASGPGGVAAKLQGVPLLVHEQNSVAGLTNKLLAKMAKRVLLGFEGAIESKKSVWVGNPSREEIMALQLENKTLHSPAHVLVMGGSLGALALNQRLPELFKPYEKAGQITVLHQAGKGRKTATEQAYEAAGVDATVVEFIDDVADKMRWADVMVCRSGASTVTEIALAGIPALFVPFPFAVDDHQTHNAQQLVEKGGAALIQENELEAQRFADAFEPMIEPITWQAMMQAQKQMGEKLQHATAAIVAEIEECIHGR